MANIFFIVLMAGVGTYLPVIGFDLFTLEFWVLLGATAIAYILGGISNG